MTETLAAVISLVSAFFFALSAVSMKKGLVTSEVLGGSVVTMTSGTMFLWALLPLYIHTITLNPTVILLFVAAGVSGTTLGRITMYIGMKETSAPVATSLANLAPVLASAIGFSLLNEVATIPRVIGIFLAVAGAITLSSEGGSAGWKKRAIVLPLIGSIFFGLGQAMRKTGLIIQNTPLFGGAVNNTSAMLTVLLLFYLMGGTKRFGINRRNVPFFIFAGILESIGVLLGFTALGYGSLSTVTPALNAHPIFVLILGSLLLKKVEKITMRTIVGVLMIVIGVISVGAF